MRRSTQPEEIPEMTSGGGLLQRVAVALGVPVDAFYVLPEQHIFHMSAAGSRWILSSGARGVPTVSCLSSQASDQIAEGEPVTAFLIRNLDRPEGQALAALIERMLTMHLHLDLRG